MSPILPRLRWSFGVVLYELITLGRAPYPTTSNRDLLRRLQLGYRMGRPDACPPSLWVPWLFSNICITLYVLVNQRSSLWCGVRSVLFPVWVSMVHQCPYSRMESNRPVSGGVQGVRHPPPPPTTHIRTLTPPGQTPYKNIRRHNSMYSDPLMINLQK